MLGSALERCRSLEPDRQRRLVYTAVIANTLVLLLLVYAVTTERSPTAFWAVPVVWLTVSAWALFRSSPAPADPRAKVVAGTVALGYFALLAFVGGLVAPAGEVAVGLTVQVTDLPPGWNPAILYSGATVQVALVPFTAFGYLTLAYLVYATALEAKSAVAGGVLGVFSCVSCTLPVLASLAGSVLGGGAALVAAASAQTYALGTIAFVLTTGLLIYRPGLDRLRKGL
jgi:hypothetical protein